MDEIAKLIYLYTGLYQADQGYQACRDAIEQALQEAKCVS